MNPALQGNLPDLRKPLIGLVIFSQTGLYAHYHHDQSQKGKGYWLNKGQNTIAGHQVDIDIGDQRHSDHVAVLHGVPVLHVQELLAGAALDNGVTRRQALVELLCQEHHADPRKVARQDKRKNRPREIHRTILR